ncbi:MAG: class I SAM-dependent methyltransferase [Nitrospiraceae bacterium]|nr:MAG: class I SAM-dependent methyltransferase [Nitrospiraceae bacterium]
MTMGENDLYKGYHYHQDFKSGMGLKYKQVLELTRGDQSVLEVGCHSGYLGEVLKKRGNKVWGVEINREAARSAEQFYEKVFTGSIEDQNIWDAISRKYDVILFLDVLEHLVNPRSVLVKSRELLYPGGFIIATIPNVASYGVRKELLFGRYDYQDSGVLDKTHLRFFTFYSARQFIKDCGYSVVDWSVTKCDLPLEYKLPFFRPVYDWSRSFLSRSFPNLFGVVVLFKAVPQK